MSVGRQVAFVLGLVVIVILLSRLPDDVYRTSQAFLVVTAGAILFLFAAGVLLAPARRVLARLFGYGWRDGPAFSVATGEELRDMMRPLFVALVLVAAAGVPAVVRALVP